MIAVIKGDIISSRSLKDQNLWLAPLKKFLSEIGQTPEDWEIVWGDFFQIIIKKPENALLNAFKIRALIKQIRIDSAKKRSNIDVRMGMGIGEQSFVGEKVSESNGNAFIYASEIFNLLKKENLGIGVKTGETSIDDEVNLCLKLAEIFMSKWTVSSAELVNIVLNRPEITQKEIEKILGIKQNSVSGRWKRAHIDDLLAIDKMYRKKIKKITG